MTDGTEFGNFKYRICFRPVRKADPIEQLTFYQNLDSFVHYDAFQQQWTSGCNMSTTADMAVEQVWNLLLLT
jgi:hypothetical protein